MKGDKAPTASRSWVLTVPVKDCLTLDEMRATLGDWPAVGQRERGEKTGYEHWQVYINSASPIRFTTVKRRFPTAHIEPRREAHGFAFWYCQKDDTRLGDQFNTGMAVPAKPEPGTGAKSLDDLHERVISGLSVDDLLMGSPKAVAHWRGLRETESAVRKKRWRAVTRDVEVHYIYGPAGVGKTRWVYEKEGFEQVYAPGSYRNPWDFYGEEPVILLDEFAGQISFEFLLKFLDRYPLLLPARYSDRWAAFSRVYIVSNLSLEQIYSEVRADPARSDQWHALMRRITSYAEMVAPGVFEARPKPEPGQSPFTPSRVALTEAELVDLFGS